MKLEQQNERQEGQNMESERQERYLERVLRQLEKEQKKIYNQLESRKQEISRMQEYYWESYTEYDEYGYEKQDNDRLYREERSAQNDLLRRYDRIRKMLDSPYFAAVDFRYDGEEEAESYYIGIGDFSPNRAEPPLICDWRAPVSGLFYDYDCGRAAFLAPMGELTGELLQKYQFKIREGKLLYAISGDMALHDEVLGQELAKNANARLRSIVGTIQKEQNAIIRNEKDHILVIQGSAGSGKTSVALHRVAYLLYHHRDTISADRILILSPNPVFSEYISHILPELGEENILEMSLDLFAYRRLSAYGEAEDKYEYLEELLAFPRSEAERLSQETERRQSREYAEELQRFVLELEDELVDIRELNYKKVHREVQELRTLFYEKFPDIPLLARMRTLADYIVDEEETLAGREFDVLERGIILEKLERMYEERNVRRLYERFLTRRGLYTADGGKAVRIPYRDVYPILYLDGLLNGFPKQRGIRHLLIDEMQDYSYLQFLIVSRLFPCDMTILGDREQALEPEKRETKELCRNVFGRRAVFLELEKSYRSTVEIMRFANRVAGLADGALFERHGRRPEYVCAETEEEMLRAIAHAIAHAHVIEGRTRADEAGRDPYATTAILTRTAAEAARVFGALGERLGLQLLTSDSERMEQGIVVAPVYLAKGLEFDSVHVAYVQEETYASPYDRRLLYIAVTRALHEVSLYGFGTPDKRIEDDIENA